MGQRATHRAPGHRLGGHARTLISAALAAALLGIPLAAAAPASADTSNQWPLQYLKVDQDWPISKGTGVTVAVLDTGVAKIPDTRAALLPGADFSSGTTSSGNGQEDLQGHGTEMAVLIAGTGGSLEGLAPAAKILPVRINAEGTGNDPDLIAAGVEYAVSHHASVINLSETSLNSATLASAIQDALNHDVVVVAGSGNDSKAAVSYPAAYPGVVAVGATDETGAIWPGSDTGPQIALSAPGVNLPVEDDTGAVGSGSGTSASTAYVSATVALIRSAHPSWTAAQVIRDLIATADPGPGQSAGTHSDQYGYGIVDPLKALQASAPTNTSNPLLGSASAAPTGGANSGVSPADTAASTPGSNSANPKSSGNALVGGIIVLVVLAGVVLLIVWLVRRNRNRGGPGGPGGQPPYQGGGPTGPGYGYGVPPQQEQPGSYPQPPYQQPPYPQAPARYPAPQQYPAPQPPQYPTQPPPQQQPPEQQNPYGYR